MKQITTRDNSVTFYNEEFGETYHSVTGAEEEAIKKYAEPSNLEIKSQEGIIKILDICFGLGYNSAASIDLIQKYNSDCKIEIIAIENDEMILNKILEVNPNFKSYVLIKKTIINKTVKNNYEFNKNNLNLKIILDNALNSVKKLQQENQTFDLVFLDPFSPKKCPELWSESFFRDIFKLCKNGTILTTYSCAKSVRNNLELAGFKIKDGPCVGRRSPSTIGVVEG